MNQFGVDGIPAPSDPGGYFGHQVQAIRPKVLKPLRFCEFRTKDAQTSAVDGCAILACGEVEGMSLCYQHGPIIVDGLAKEMG